MKPLEYFQRIFMSRSGVSSKRVCGVLGWLVCLIICLFCTLNGIQAPEIIDTLFICSTTLLGADSVVKIFNWRKNENNCKNS